MPKHTTSSFSAWTNDEGPIHLQETVIYDMDSKGCLAPHLSSSVFSLMAYLAVNLASNSHRSFKAPLKMASFVLEFVICTDFWKPQTKMATTRKTLRSEFYPTRERGAFVLRLNRFYKTQRGWTHRWLQQNISVSLQGSHSAGSYPGRCVCVRRYIRLNHALAEQPPAQSSFPPNPESELLCCLSTRADPQKEKILWNELKIHFNTRLSSSLSSHKLPSFQFHTIIAC